MTLLDMVPGIDVVGGAANGEEAIARTRSPPSVISWPPSWRRTSR
ncbi:hypothetical protein ACWCXH_13215 [Kitasatospora sp. NPDC001660]